MSTIAKPHASGKRNPEKPVAAKRDPDQLRVHKASGRWIKKVKGRLIYFTKLADDPQGHAANEQWLKERDEWRKGGDPRNSPEVTGIVLGDLCNKWLERQESRRNSHK